MSTTVIEIRHDRLAALAPGGDTDFVWRDLLRAIGTGGPSSLDIERFAVCGIRVLGGGNDADTTWTEAKQGGEPLGLASTMRDQGSEGRRNSTDGKSMNKLIGALQLLRSRAAHFDTGAGQADMDQTLLIVNAYCNERVTAAVAAERELCAACSRCRCCEA